MADPIKPFTKNRPTATAPQTGAMPGTATLPPAGHKRDEELKQRADTLEQQAEKKYAGVESMDIDALEIERELAGHFNQLEVSNANPNLVYKWVNFVSNGGLMLRQAIAPPERWETVTGDRPEALELKAIDGSRKLGDVMLLCMPRKRYEAIMQARANIAARQQQGHEGNLRALAKRHAKSIKVYGSENAMPDHMTQKLQNPSQSAINAMRGAEAASKQFDQALRSGAISV